MAELRPTRTGPTVWPAVSWLLLVLGCAPQPLSEPLDSGGTEADASSPDVQEDVSDVPEFATIADVIRQSCAISSGCHAGQGNRGFGVPGGTMADDSTVAEVLQETQIGGSDPLVVPGNADQSALYQVLVGANGRPVMPQNGALDDSTIETVRLWIDDGANYGD